MTYKMDAALMQAERDLIALNDADRYAIDSAKRRIEGRSFLLKALRRRMRRRGCVNVSGDSSNPTWMLRDNLR